MAKTINVRFQQKYATAEEWKDSTIKLLAGEIAIESDTGKFKFGDGEHTFAELNYAGIDAAQLEAIEDNYYEVVPTGAETDEQAIVRVVTTPKKGDIAVVKRVIGEISSNLSYTAYVYSGTAWAAMDGNYSAANVFTASKITLAGDYGLDSRKDKITSIGNLRIGDEIAAGTSLQSLLMDMLSQRLQPAIVTNPSISVTLAQAGAKEVGTTVTPTFTASGNDGKYTYEETTGVTFSDWEVKTSGRNTVHEGEDLAVETKAAASGSFTAFVVDEDTNYKLTVTAKGTAGNVAKDNLGDPSSPAVQIAAKNDYSASSSAVTGFRGCFYGYYNSKKLDPANLTSAQVRALCTAPKAALTEFLTYDNTNKYYYVTTNKMQQMFFAAPKGKYTSVAVANSTNGAPQTVTKITDVDVEGADGFTAADYDIFYVDNAGAESGETKFKVTIA